MPLKKMHQVGGTRSLLALALAATGTICLGGRSAGAQDLMRDDFSGATLNNSIWSLGTWSLDRTRLGLAPTITGGMARLRFDTYNPNNPGGSFLGTEIWSNAQYDRGTGGEGLELEARVRVNAIPDGLVTSFFTYGARLQFSPPLADEIDFEHVSKMHNPAAAGSKPVLMTTWNDYRTDGSNFGDPNVHNSLSVVAPGVDLAQFNTYRLRWLGNRVEWYINGKLLRTTSQAVATDLMNVRLNFWAPSSTWGAAYSAALQPANLPSSNQTWWYDADFVAVRRAYKPIAATGVNRVMTDRFKNATVANTDSATGYWTQRNQGTASVTETTGDPLKLTVSGAGYPHAQIVSGVRSDLNFFRSPIRLTADGIDFQSSSNSFGKSILRFVLSPQTLAAGSESEYTAEDAFSLRIQGDNQVAMGFKLNAANTNSEFSNLLLQQTMSGPVRRVTLTLSPGSYALTVEHETSATDGTRVSSTFTGAMNLSLSDWRVGTSVAATGSSAVFVQGQFNNSGAGESMTALVDSMSIDTVRSVWNINGGGNWGSVGSWSADGVPDGTGANVLFGSAIGTPVAVTLGTNVRAGVVTFDNANRYTVGGAGGVTMQSPAVNAEITVVSGSHTLGVPVTLASNTVVVVNTGSVLTTGAVTSTGGTLRVSGPGVLSAARLAVPGVTVTAGTLRVTADGTSAATSTADTISVTGGLLDLTNNDLVVRQMSVSAVRAQVAGWWNGGLRNGSGLGSSLATVGGVTTLGVRSNTTGFGFAAFTSFSGVSVSATDVLVKYTYLGDTDFNGLIDARDVSRVLTGWTNGLTGWENGDTNYDGVVNGTDYANVLAALTGQGAVLDGSGPAGGGIVPEPTGVLTGLAVAACVAGRRRR